MKNEFLAIHGNPKLHGSYCRQCQRDTPHAGPKCLTCGSFRAMKGAGNKPRTWDKSLAKQAVFKRIRDDRRAALVRQAEESRRKFETR